MLLVAIAAASSLLVFAFSLVRSSALQPTLFSSRGAPNENATGHLRLVINVVGSQPAQTASGPLQTVVASTQSPGSAVPPMVAAVSALPPVNFTVVGVGASNSLVRLVMPQPGEVDIPARVGFYAIATRNQYYNLTASAEVLANSVTEVEINVTEAVSPVIFSVVSNPDGSQVIASWEPLTVEVAGTPAAPARGSTVFLRYSGPESCPSPACQFPSGTLLSRVLLSDPRVKGLWLLISPEEPLRVHNLGSLQLLSYRASYTVGYNVS